MKFTFKKIFSIKEPRNGLLFIFILSLILAGSVFFISNKDINANYDYICTKVETIDNSTCVVPADGWGEWQVVTPASTSTLGQEKRTGSGLIESILKRTYIASTRRGCGTGYTSVADTSKFHGGGWTNGDTVIISTVCNVDEFNVLPMLPLTCVAPQVILPDGTCGTCPVGGCVCVAPQVRLANGTCGNRERIDLCPNIDGIQETLGDLSVDTHTGDCGRGGGDSDVCLNIDGFQSVVPLNMYPAPNRTCTVQDPTKDHDNIVLTSACTAKQGTSNIVYLNKDMTWTVEKPTSIPAIGTGPNDITITETDWTGTDILPVPPAKVVTTKGTNVLHKIYTTVGLKTVTGILFAEKNDGKVSYKITCQNNGAGKSPLNVTFGGGSTVEE